MSVLRRRPGKLCPGCGDRRGCLSLDPLVSGGCRVWEFSQEEEKAALADGASVCVSHTTPGSMNARGETAPCSSSSFEMHASPGRCVKVQTLAQQVQVVLCIAYKFPGDAGAHAAGPGPHAE